MAKVRSSLATDDTGALARAALHHRLTPQQLAFFDTFGYLVLPGLL
jgi:hypothetical protein